MKTMYPGKINSPETKLTSAIGEAETVIPVQDASVFPDAPNICTIGVGDDAETIRYAAKTENSLSGCERGFQGTAKSWQSGETISRNFTEYDYAALMEHIEKNTSDITSHKHAIADVNDLQAALDSKSDSAHNHDTAYLGIDAKAKDSAKLGGHLPSYFAKNSDLTAHDGKKVSDDEGVHGLRYRAEQETLQYHDGSDWVDISGGSTKYPPGNVTDLSVEAKNRKLIIKWSDPGDTEVEGIVLSEWSGTKVVYKTGGYPTSPEDGTLAVDNKARNKYKTNGLEIADLENNTPVYIQLFPYSTKNAVNSNEANRVSGTPSAVPPNNVTNISTKIGNGSITVKWTDPVDTMISGQNVVWAGTKIRYKAGSPITDENDGTLAVDSKVRDQYKTNGFTISGLSNGTQYYIKAFPYSTTGAVNKNIANMVQNTPMNYKTMGVKIDLNNSNPAAVEYIEDAVGMSAQSGAWDEFFGYYPCILKDGVETTRLNPNDFTKSVTGATVNLASEDVGDVMICFPLRGYKIETIGNYLYVYVTEDPRRESEGFVYYAHIYKGSIRQKLYIGAFLGHYTASNQGYKIRSWADKTIVSNTSFENMRAQIEKQSGYHIMAYYQLVYLQCMFLLIYKTRDSESAFGQPYINSGSETLYTGNTKRSGMFARLVGASWPMKFAGIEDLIGRKFCLIDGIVLKDNLYIQKSSGFFNSSNSGYTRHSVYLPTGWTTQVHGNSEIGFLPKQSGGSKTTYFASNGSFDTNSIGAKLGQNMFGMYMRQENYFGGHSNSLRIMYL